MATNPTSEALGRLTRRLQQLKAAADNGDAGVIPMRHLFDLAREFTELDLPAVEQLLTDADHPPRVVAVSIMDFAARRRSTPTDRRSQLYKLYLARHDQINTWDLVDRAAPHVVGGWLWDKSRRPLYQLAASPRWWERRTAIVATWYFIRLGDLNDTFAIADSLAEDPHDLVQKAVGGWVREAGKRDPRRLRSYLDRHAATMPRTTLRYAVEKLDPESRRHYLQLKDVEPPA